MIELQELFYVQYGTKLDLNKMQQVEKGVPFVSRTSQNNGISAYVKEIVGVDKMPAGSISVSLGGTKLLSSFVQDYGFYTAQNVAVLIPKKEMTLQQKLFICLCIERNRFRYSAFGREANRTIKYIRVPSLENFPDWVVEEKLTMFNGAKKPLRKKNIDLKGTHWSTFRFDEIFDIKKGKRLTKANMKPGKNPFIGSTDRKNGVTNFVGQSTDHVGNVITVNYNGSVGEAFYQPNAFLASDDVNVLYPRDDMFPKFNQYIALFIISLIKLNKFRFSYGRKWHKERMEETPILLPVAENGKLNLDFMENYILALPFSSKI
ncbi:restriction endonuclease subunit S [Vreelandella sp. EE7]